MNQNPGIDRDLAYDLAKRHPRVSLESKTTEFGAFELIPAEYPPVFEAAKRYQEEACPIS